MLKHSKKFSDFIKELSFSDDEFTLNSCEEVTKYFENIKDTNEAEFVRLFKQVAPILELNDHLQISRLEILMGVPQILITESSTSKYAWPMYGLNRIHDNDTKIIEYRPTKGGRTSTCFLKRISQANEKLQIELFLEILQACETNPVLLKYLQSMPSEDIQNEK